MVLLASDLTNPWTVLGYIVLGSALGMIGQGIRVVVGIKKAQDEAAAEGEDFAYDFKKLSASLLIAFVIGGIAGALAVLPYVSRGGEITFKDVEVLIGVGYAGTDFIEGFMKKKLPS